MKGTEPFDADRFVTIGREVMNRVASAGKCVIVGRGAPYFLRELPDVFQRFPLCATIRETTAPAEDRAQREKKPKNWSNTVDRDPNRIC